MSRYYLNWSEDDTVWNSEQRHWEDVYIIIQDLMEQSGGARNPQEWGDHPFDLLDDDRKFHEIREQLQHNLDRMTEQNKSKLIEVLILMGEAKVSDKKKPRKDIRITVDDVRTIARQLTVEISHIKQ